MKDENLSFVLLFGFPRFDWLTIRAHPHER